VSGSLFLRVRHRDLLLPPSLLLPRSFLVIYPGYRSDYGRNGAGWIQRNRAQPEMLYNPTYETRMGHVSPYNGYTYL
jgi:hypothetical protein